MSAKLKKRPAAKRQAKSPGTIQLGGVTVTLSAIPGKVSPAARQMAALFAAAGAKQK